MFSLIRWFFSSQKFYYLALLLEKDKWSIHGLWPQYNKSDYPTYCKEVSFDIEKLSPILDELNKYWSSYEKSDNDVFWEHEWKKHGSCYFKNIDELGYFETTLRLYHQVIAEDLVEKYRDGDRAMIPFDLNLNVISNR
jgi:ribonuclease T2